jgi:hypothetical protein
MQLNTLAKYVLANSNRHDHPLFGELSHSIHVALGPCSRSISILHGFDVGPQCGPTKTDPSGASSAS